MLQCSCFEKRLKGNNQRRGARLGVFGLAMPDRSSNSANPNDNYKFTGHERDEEAGMTLDYMNARTYDPALGRFLQIDPLAEKFPSSSPYVYALNNPVRLVDPDGRAAVYPFLITVRTYIPYQSSASI